MRYYLRAFFCKLISRLIGEEVLPLWALVFIFIFTGLLSPLISSVDARPIYPDQYRWEKPKEGEPPKSKAISLRIDAPEHKRRDLYAFDARDGLNAEEAALLAAITLPYIVSLRATKGEFYPELIKSGVLPPLRIKTSKENVVPSWLPEESLALLKKAASPLLKVSAEGPLELESAWLEWQASTAARLYIYRKVNSRRILNVLRQIEKVYKDIYKTAARAENKKLYSKDRVAARLGYKKMIWAAKKERVELNESRVGLNHALGLPTNIDVTLERGITFTTPDTIPSVKALIDSMSYARIDFLAMQKGIAENNKEVMSYINAKFNVIYISITAKKKEDWLNAAVGGPYISFPLFETNHGDSPFISTDVTLLAKSYIRRVKTAKVRIPRLVDGIALISAELQKIEKILPDLRKKSGDGSEKSPVLRLQQKKRVLAVRLFRLRLLRKLMDAGIALEISSGNRIF